MGRETVRKVSVVLLGLVLAAAVAFMGVVTVSALAADAPIPRGRIIIVNLGESPVRVWPSPDGFDGELGEPVVIEPGQRVVLRRAYFRRAEEACFRVDLRFPNPTWYDTYYECLLKDEERRLLPRRWRVSLYPE